MCHREGEAGCVNIVTCGIIYKMTGLYKGSSLLDLGKRELFHFLVCFLVF